MWVMIVLRGLAQVVFFSCEEPCQGWVLVQPHWGLCNRLRAVISGSSRRSLLLRLSSAFEKRANSFLQNCWRFQDFSIDVLSNTLRERRSKKIEKKTLDFEPCADGQAYAGKSPGPSVGLGLAAFARLQLSMARPSPWSLKAQRLLKRWP